MRDRPYFPGFRSREADRTNATGLAAMRAGDFERAEMLFRYALDLMPHQWGLWMNLGNSVGNRGRHREALAHYEHAHTLAPLEYAPRLNAAYAHLQLGQYREGWALYEERWRDPVMRELTSVVAGMFDVHDALAKRWDGVPREEKSLLLFPEQGAGDCLMMLRYWGALADTGMQIIYRVPASLYRLVRRNVPKGTQIVTTNDRVPAHDWHCPLMSLPFLFGMTSAADIPGADGYLAAKQHPALLDAPRLTVGLVWAGNPAHKGDAWRTMGIGPLRRLQAHTAADFVSFQIGDRAKDGECWPGLVTIKPHDFQDTAQYLTAVDLLVSVDTATAHLAGALGVRTLLMVSKNSDWRWGIEGKQTPWYRSVELVRQQRLGDWRSVVSYVSQFLSEELRQRRAA